MSLRWVNGKILFFLFAVMLMTHLVIFVIYSQHNRNVQFEVNRDIISRQLINFLQTVQNTPENEQQTIVKAVDNPNFKVSLDKDAKSAVRFEETSLWQVLKNISGQSPGIEFSYQLSPQHWLNITAEIVRSNWGLHIVLLSMEVMIMMAVLLFFWIIHHYTVPFTKFAAAAERLGIDLGTEPLPITGPKVARMAAEAINKMQARIQDLIQARTQMLAAISHDLRTPITRLKLRSQLSNDPEQFSKIAKDLDEMETMIAETLAFARDDSKTEKRIKLDLASLLAAICEDYVEMQHAVTYQVPNERLPVRAGAVSLQRVFSNLIGNALKYAGDAEIALVRAADEVIVTICDHGPGIPKDQLTKVFLPFYRSEVSRSRKTGGIGLGLAVAQDIIMTHGGRISIENRQVQGVCVTVVLPLLVDAISMR